MNITIGQLQLSELIALLRVQADDAFPDLKDEERLKMLAEKWNKCAEFCTCRDDYGLLVGVIVFYANGQGADFAYIAHVYVSVEYRKQGIFSKMLYLLTQYVSTKGFCEVRLEVAKDNKVAQQSYLYNGFTFLPNEMNEKSVYMNLPISLSR